MAGPQRCSAKRPAGVGAQFNALQACDVEAILVNRVPDALEARICEMLPNAHRRGLSEGVRFWNRSLPATLIFTNANPRV